MLHVPLVVNFAFLQFRRMDNAIKRDSHRGNENNGIKKVYGAKAKYFHIFPKLEKFSNDIE